MKNIQNPKSQISSSPRLAKGNDSEVATKLGELVRDAQDGTRRILICGLFIETIVANLKHGQLGPWIDAHESEIGAKRTQIFAWRQFSSEVLTQLKIQKSDMPDFSLPLHEALSLPPAQVPEDVREVRAKIDDLIAGKSVRQLLFQFRECDVFEDEIVRTGRGGDRAASRKGRRTNAEIEADQYTLDARAACTDLRRAFLNHFAVGGPGGARAWDILDDAALKELKEFAIDLRDGIHATETRRAQFRKK